LPGNYTVSLTVTDVYDFTDTETKVDYITVNPPAYIGPVWHISPTGSDVWGNGSEQYPFATIQHGINTSSNTDTILVQPGTYVENINYNGKLVTVASLFLTTQDTTYISSTIIDGNSSGSVVAFNSGEDSTAVLCGFTITNGSAGGIYCYNSSPKLENVTITGNITNYGGGICCWYSSPSLVNVRISGNTTSADGGGIYCYDSSPSLENVTISGNSADYGGGIYCELLFSPSLKNVTITGNSANNGGGIYCTSSSLSLINSILWNDSPQEIDTSASGEVTATYSDIQGGWTGTGNIDEDPLFADPGNGDFHLQSTSPCIDAGDPASPLDPDGTIVEMGAYYFPQLNADFTADTTNGEVPLTVNFTDLSTQGSGVIDEWYWEFGDGNNSSLQHPDNEYLLLGIYTVSLTVTDVNDSTGIETKVDYITVNPPAYSGSIWHISITGSDVWGNGSEQYPFATIQHGINNSADTDTVLVQPGTYVENIIYNGKLITVGSLFLTTQEWLHYYKWFSIGKFSGKFWWWDFML
jgi:predicted outer membrane repeat protein